MNQFHTPSFGDVDFVIEMSDVPDRDNSRRYSCSVEEYQPTNDSGGNHNFDAPSETNTTPPTTHKQIAVVAPLTTANATSKPSNINNNSEPAKPLSSYALFFRDTVNAIKTQNPTCAYPEISAIVSQMWEALDETNKNHYNLKHEQAKQDYIVAMRIYRDQQSEQQQEDATTTQFNSTLINSTQLAQQQQESIQQPQLFMPTANNNTTNNLTCTDTDGTVALATANTPTPQQIQLLTEAAETQKCTRDNCNKPAIINPDWEDEYCSNECVVIHCRTVFTDWVKSKMNMLPAATNPTTTNPTPTLTAIQQ